jgi:hypothetical protein
MIATITIGTVSLQGVLMRVLPGGMARIAIRGRVHVGRYVPPMRRTA